MKRIAFIAVVIFAMGSIGVIAQSMDGWEIEFTGGFGDAANIKIESLQVFGGDLFAGTHNANGCRILKRAGYPTRSAWSVVATGGFGDGSNHAATAMEEFTYTLINPITALYVGTQNSSGGAEIWQYRAGTWSQANADGFGSSNNYSVGDLEVFGNTLFAATSNSTAGAEIWGFTGITWSPFMTGGFGDVDATMITSLTAFGGKIYASTMNPNGGDIWESSDGSHWTRSVTEGFFSAYYGNGVAGMASASGVLYAAVVSNIYGVSVWKIVPGGPVAVGPIGFADWYNLSALAMTEFRGELWVGTHNSDTGTEIWRMSESTWQQQSPDGFGDADNIETSSMAVYEDRLLVGLWNSTNGAELRRFEGLFRDGFETGNSSRWDVTVN